MFPHPEGEVARRAGGGNPPPLSPSPSRATGDGKRVTIYSHLMRVLIDGVAVTEVDASVSVFDWVVLRGFGVFGEADGRCVRRADSGDDSGHNCCLVRVQG